jgi:hypothetical protein
MTQVDKGLENLGKKIINNEEGEIEGDDKETQVGKEDEALPQLTFHTQEKVSAKTFVRKLAQGEKFQNGVTQEAPVVFQNVNQLYLP